LVCHCAGRLADSLADNKQVPSDGCKRGWRAECMPHHGAASAFVSKEG
jgi:hypothetical protein